MTQSVIIYRSITEQRFDELINNSEYTFPIMIAVVIYIICVVAMSRPIEKILRRFVKDSVTYQNIISPIQLIIPIIPAFAVFKFVV